MLRRRLDIEFGDDLEACEGAGSSDWMAPYLAAQPMRMELTAKACRPRAILAAQEAASSNAPPRTRRGLCQLEPRPLPVRALPLALRPADALGDDRDELARRIARLYMAITELRAAFEDDDVERRSRAEDLRKEYTLQLGQLREAAGSTRRGRGCGRLTMMTTNSSIRIRTRTTVLPCLPAWSMARLQAPCLGLRSLSARAVRLHCCDIASRLGGWHVASCSSQRRSRSESRVPCAHQRSAEQGDATHGTATARAEPQPQWERDGEARTAEAADATSPSSFASTTVDSCGRIFCDACSSKRAQLRMAEMVVDPIYRAWRLRDPRSHACLQRLSC